MRSKFAWATLSFLFVALSVFGCRQYESYSRDKDDACIREEAEKYRAKYISLYAGVFDSQAQIKRQAKSPKSDRRKAKKNTSRQREEIPFVVPPLIPGVLQSLLSLERDVANRLGCLYPPMALDARGAINKYDASWLPSPPCYPGSVVAPPPDSLITAKIVQNSSSVGRLAIVDNRIPDSPPAFWGTGFLIASHVFATPCHVMAPLLDKSNNLKLDQHESLVVDFAATNSPSGLADEIKVKGVFGCTEHSGLDVALLNLCDSYEDCSLTLPSQPLPLFSGKFEDIKSERLTLVGYADLDHFIDPDRRAMYDPWVKNKISSKFVMWDSMIDVDSCEKSQNTNDKSLDVLLDSDITTVGESGSVVLSLGLPNNAPSGPVHGVVGVHTCCSAYFEYSEGTPPGAYLKCARLRRTFHNQDISSWSIIGDPTLCKVLKDRKAMKVDAAGMITAIDSCPTAQ